MNPNKMREIKIEKLVLSCGGSGDKIDKGARLLRLISGMQVLKRASRKRIPSLGVRPGLEVGCKVTIRKDKIAPLLKRLLQSVNNEVKEKQVVENHFSFGIHEYIEIPGMEYQREIGLLGLNVTIDFVRSGKRIERRKIKTSKAGKSQIIQKEEIIAYMEKNFNTKFTRKEAKDGSK